MGIYGSARPEAGTQTQVFQLGTVLTVLCSQTSCLFAQPPHLVLSIPPTPQSPPTAPKLRLREDPV